MIDKQYENELIHEIDHIQRQVKELEKDCYLYKAAFEKACELLSSNSKMDMHEWFHHLLKEVGEEDD